MPALYIFWAVSATAGTATVPAKITNSNSFSLVIVPRTGDASKFKAKANHLSNSLRNLNELGGLSTFDPFFSFEIDEGRDWSLCCGRKGKRLRRNEAVQYE
jgi:hypothetical protein